MTDEQKIKSHAIIHSASALAASVGAGLAQLPCSDNIPLISIQTTMILALGSVFGVRLNQSSSEAVLATTMASVSGRVLCQLILGWVPILGNVVNAATAVGITETIGFAVMSDFSNRSVKSIKDGK